MVNTKAKVARIIRKILKRYPRVKIGFTEHNSFNNYDSEDVRRERIIYKSGKCIVRYKHTCEPTPGKVTYKYSRYGASCFMEYIEFEDRDLNLRNTINYMFNHDNNSDGHGWLRVKEIRYGKGFKRKVEL